MFAKIFQLTSDAQVLLVKEGPDDKVDEWRLVQMTEFTTQKIFTYRHRVNGRTFYQTQAERDAAFDKYTEADAQAFVERMKNQIPKP